MKQKQPSAYSQKLVDLALQIPRGRVTTYGILNRLAGGTPRMAQMVTHILGKSEQAGAIPFHRIVYSDGRCWSAAEYSEVRMKLYKQEHIIVTDEGKIKNFKGLLYEFD